MEQLVCKHACADPEGVGSNPPALEKLLYVSLEILFRPSVKYVDGYIYKTCQDPLTFWDKPLGKALWGPLDILGIYVIVYNDTNNVSPKT